MAETVRLPITDQDNHTVNTLLEQLAKVSKSNIERTEHFEGRRRLNMISEAVPPFYHRLNLMLGWSGKAITYLARRCLLDGVAVPETHKQQWAQLAAQNSFTTEVANAIHESLLYGVGFLVTTAATPPRTSGRRAPGSYARAVCPQLHRSMEPPPAPPRQPAHHQRPRPAQKTSQPHPAPTRTHHHRRKSRRPMGSPRKRALFRDDRRTTHLPTPTR
jgi:hypothetical protein